MALPDGELLDLLSDLESDRVERKRMVREDKDRLGEAICAFANDLPGHGLPGVLFVGVNDDGQVTGLKVGGHQQAAQGACRDFRSLAAVLLDRLGIART